MDSITTKADVDHLQVPRKQGERGLMQWEEAYLAEITKLMENYKQQGWFITTYC